MNNPIENSRSYDALYKWVHWLMAVLVLLMFMAFFGFAQADTDAKKMEMLLGHSSIGTLITILIVIRLTKRFVIKSPVPQQNISETQKKLAHVGHMALYILLVLVPVSGYLTANAHQLPVMVFSQFQLGAVAQYSEEMFMSFRFVHETAIKVLLVTLIAHIGAAVFHGLVKKDGVFSSMWPGKNK